MPINWIMDIGFNVLGFFLKEKSVKPKFLYIVEVKIKSLLFWSGMAIKLKINYISSKWITDVNIFGLEQIDLYHWLFWKH